MHLQKGKTRTSEAGSHNQSPHMPPFISNNLKACIQALHHEHGFSVKRICSILNVTTTLAYETLCHYCTHGIGFDLNAWQWGVWHHDLTSVDLAFMHVLLNQKHTTKSKSNYSPAAVWKCQYPPSHTLFADFILPTRTSQEKHWSATTVYMQSIWTVWQIL